MIIPIYGAHEKYLLTINLGEKRDYDSYHESKSNQMTKRFIKS